MLPTSIVDSEAKETPRSTETASGKEEQVSCDPSRPVQIKGDSKTEPEPIKEEQVSGDQSQLVQTKESSETEPEPDKKELVVSGDQPPPVQTKEDSQTELEPDKEEQVAGDQSPPAYANGDIPTEPEPSKDAPQSPEMSERRIMKNVLVICFVFFLNFMAYSGMAMLQSSLHREEGMGVITSAIGWASLALGCLLLPKIVIRLLGHKWCMSIALIGYVLWMAANGYAVWATMIPASIIVGVSGAVLWTTQGAYFAVFAKHYARKTGQDPKEVTAFFFGILFASFRTS